MQLSKSTGVGHMSPFHIICISMIYEKKIVSFTKFKDVGLLSVSISDIPEHQKETTHQ